MTAWVPNSTTWNAGTDAADPPSTVGIPFVAPVSARESVCPSCHLIKSSAQIGSDGQCADCH
jgi:hypothetical protein